METVDKALDITHSLHHIFMCCIILERERERKRREELSAPSEQDTIPIIEKEVSEMSGGVDATATEEAEAEAEAEADLYCLSGDKPFFNIILSKSHISYPYRLFVPSHSIGMLPRENVTLVLKHGVKKWDVVYSGKGVRPGFEASGWRRFVSDNDLKCEDACIFEVINDGASTSSGSVEVKVVILRGTDCLPAELQPENDDDPHGKTVETAIDIE